MNNFKSLFFKISLLFLIIISGCQNRSPSLSVTPSPVIERSETKTETIGTIIAVTSTDDEGAGTLREALQTAQSGDTIVFDPSIFQQDIPATIYIKSILPPLNTGDLTIDANESGVILDGSKISSGWNGGIQIYSDHNTVRGLQITGFSGAGIVIGIGQENLIEENVSVGNDFGIGLWGDETKNNIIKNNQIGVFKDGRTPSGNKNAGVLILEQASGNTIGNGNTIAYNGSFGIDITDSGTINNLITQNQIFLNGDDGISIRDGGNLEIKPPVVFDFNLTKGSISGTACSGCKIEIFSDKNSEGEIFEGQSVADDNGNFNFEGLRIFSGPSLTTVAIDPNGNTSQFSQPTSGTERILIMQIENNYPKFRLEPKKSFELDDNRMGSVGMCDRQMPEGMEDDLLATMYQVIDLGLKDFRFTVICIDAEKVDWERNDFTFDPRHEEFITQMNENGINITYLLTFKDDTLGGPERVIQPRFTTEQEIQHFIEYTKFVISNVKGKVGVYEVWNEPNIKGSIQWIEPEDYINLIKRIVPVIREEDPEAKIMLAGTTYLRDEDSQNYLFEILNSDIIPLVDIISWHPFYGGSPEFDADYYYAYPGIIQQIKDTASANGFTGDYLASEMSWWTEDENEAIDWGIWYSDIKSAKYHARSIMMHLGLDIAVTNNATPSGYASRHIVDNVIRNLSTVMAGAEVAELSFEIISDAPNIMKYSFILQNGDILLAVWSDIIASENDLGVKGTLVIPGMSAVQVNGIDVLNEFRQELNILKESDDLLIEDILVKDYPIIYLLKK